MLKSMAAGTAVVASDLDAFRRVLDNGAAGRLGALDDPAAPGDALVEVLGDDALRRRYVDTAPVAVQGYHWSVVAADIMRVYETVAMAGVKVRVTG